MATKSINLSRTELVQREVLTVAFGASEDIYHKYQLNDSVKKWLDNHKIMHKFNTRKGRIKFNNDEDAVQFTLTWL